MKWKLSGDWKSCEQVLRAILWQDWEFGDKDAAWTLFGPGIERFSDETHKIALCQAELCGGDWQNVGGQWYRHALKPSERQLFWLGLAQQRFGWHLDARFHPKSAIKSSVLTHLSPFELSVPAPTGHERIEAGVFLKKWANR